MATQDRIEKIRTICPNCSKRAEEGCDPKCSQCQNTIEMFEKIDNSPNCESIKVF